LRRPGNDGSRPSRTNPRAPLAALLSFLFPGLGQAYNGDGLIAVGLAAPVVFVAVVAAILFSFAWSTLVVRLLDVRFLVGLLALDAVLLAWRLVAILQAHARRGGLHPGQWTTYLTAALVVLTIAMHALPGWYAAAVIDTLGAVAQGGGGGNGDLRDAFGGNADGAPAPSDMPDPTRERINVLLVGIDWQPGRGEHLTDTMLVVSIDPVSGRSAMISVPRDLYGARLPDGRTYNAKLNSLLVIATINRQEYPLGGVGTLKAAIGKLLGVRIDYFAAINLPGFQRAVDSIGGIDIVVPRAINDPTVGFRMDAGLHHMDGATALAYVRSRKGAGDNDFTRAARQQEVLAAIRARLTAGNLLTGLPALLASVKTTISTDVPSDQIPLLAQAVERANMATAEKAVIQPPLVRPDTGPGGAYILVPDFTAIMALGRRLMTDRASAVANSAASPTP